ncbi:MULTISPECIES: DNA primase family protein [Leucobacter]|uniref:Putative DNA primase/helicase n=1 Tax=Leucobacter luti TaxID=340320 RepID=A0A4Q7TV18_9MICO|nr:MULTISPECIES: phage/plasmid primase, P4 family [Leucobacter]RZT64593.1 putative DNA primase/helicase [Leucobacter luti]UTX52158.1 hypothetical protein KI794_10325 [Leucobacter aridicollis]
MHQNENSPGTGNTEAVEVAADATHKSTSLDAAAQLSHVDVIQRKLNLALADASDNQAKLAYHFAADHGHRVKYTAGLKWFVFDGTRYKADENEAVVTRLLLDTLRALKAEGVAEAAAALDKSDERKAAEAKTGMAANAQTSSGLDSILKIAGRLSGIAAQVSDFDAKPHLLNMPSGTLDLNTGMRHPHDPHDMLTKVTVGDYDPQAPAQSVLWDEFLATVLPDAEVLRYLQQAVGLSLWGAVLLHVLLILIGTGRNGKGVFYNAVMHALGDYATVADDGLFEATHGRNANSASPAIAKLRGARFLVSSELDEKARLDAALTKRLTGGDKLSARDLWAKPFEFDPAFTAFMVTNFLPKLPANDAAVWARVRVVPFSVVIPDAQQDVLLPEKLKAHADAVLAWAARGWTDYQANGLVTPAAVQVATQEYAESQDDVRRFIDECCNPAPLATSFVTTGLHSAYTEWAQGENIHPAHILGKTKFSQSLERLGYPGVKSRHGTAHGLVAVSKP